MLTTLEEKERYIKLLCAADGKLERIRTKKTYLRFEFSNETFDLSAKAFLKRFNELMKMDNRYTYQTVGYFIKEYYEQKNIEFYKKNNISVHEVYNQVKREYTNYSKVIFSGSEIIIVTPNENGPGNIVYQKNISEFQEDNVKTYQKSLKK